MGGEGTRKAKLNRLTSDAELLQCNAARKVEPTRSVV
jgi:hypothetical protein